MINDWRASIPHLSSTSDDIALFLTRRTDVNWTNGTVSPLPEVEFDPSLSLPMLPQFLHPTAYKGKSELTMFCINTMRNPLLVSSKTQAAYMFLQLIQLEDIDIVHRSTTRFTNGKHWRSRITTSIFRFPESRKGASKILFLITRSYTRKSVWRKKNRGS